MFTQCVFCCPGRLPDLPTSRRPARRPYARVPRPTLDRECARAGVFAAESGSPKSATAVLARCLAFAFAATSREGKQGVASRRRVPRRAQGHDVARHYACRLRQRLRANHGNAAPSSPPSHHFLAFAASRSTLIKGARKGARTTLLPWLRHTQTRSRPTFITHTRHTNVLLPSLSLPLALCSFSTQSLLPSLS